MLWDIRETPLVFFVVVVFDGWLMWINREREKVEQGIEYYVARCFQYNAHVDVFGGLFFFFFFQNVYIRTKDQK